MNQSSGIFSAAAMTTQRTIQKGFFCKTGLVIQIRYPYFSEIFALNIKDLDVKHYPIIEFVLDSVATEVLRISIGAKKQVMGLS